MIQRIVKMTFEPENIGDFLEVFNEVKDDIRQFEGVIGMELLKDLHHEHVFITVSQWESEAHLENYRRSELFKKTWPRINRHFAKKAEAWSMSPVETQ